VSDKEEHLTLQQAFDEGFKSFKGYIDRSFQERDKYTNAMEKRLKEIEARPTFSDEGVWVHDRKYLKGNGVTSDGSFWLAKRDTEHGEEPGRCDGFRLVVKRGRDGKDLRPK
jgi:hypothetical protein